MNAKKDKNITRALKIFEHLEGTLIADLKTLKVCASTPKEQNSGQGYLNYTIFLVGLVGCETLGRYVYGADLDKKGQVELLKKGSTLKAQEKIVELPETALSLQEENLQLKERIKELENNLKKKRRNSTLDVGGYIIRFIGEYFPNKDKHKLISKVLSDYLRHILAHGFAPRKDGYPFDLHLAISKEGEDPPPLACEKNNRLVIELYGIPFLNKILAAFETIKSELSKDTALASKIVVAEDYGKKNFSPPKAVMNQFIASYPKLKR